MAEIVSMPKLSDTMTDGVVAKWHKKVGDKVKSGDLLAEIETDKATMEFESFQDGVLLHIGVQEGQGAPVDSILAILGKEGEDISGLLKGNNASKAETPATAPATPEKTDAQPIQTAAQHVASTATTIVQSDSDERVKASPLAKKIAAEKGIDIQEIQGSGDNGRIVRRDIENYSPKTSTGASNDQKPSVTYSVASGVESYREEPVSQMRKTIARRLSESKFTAPHFYLTMEIDMDQAIQSRKAVNDTGLVKISFNDMVIKSAAMALKKHPKVNASWLNDKIRYNDHVHIGVAVAVEEGLLVPVVRFADSKPMGLISEEVKTAAKKAKDKKLQPSDWEGNTFTISNLGMFGIDEFTAIINPPDACIMAVGAVKEIPVVKNGNLVVGNVMKVTLSCDHRVVDGATGAAFLQTFKQYLENPVLMLAL